MNVSKITKAMSFIDDELISEAESYLPKKKYIITFIKIAAAAVVASFIIAIVLLPKESKSDGFPIVFTSTTSSKVQVLYAYEVYEHEIFGKYFPTNFPDSYNPLGKVYIINNNTLEAEFTNPKTQDTLFLKISLKNLMPKDEVIGKVVYPENSDVTSYIWIDMGEYAALCTSSKCDIATLEGFDKMFN